MASQAMGKPFGEICRALNYTETACKWQANFLFEERKKSFKQGTQIEPIVIAGKEGCTMGMWVIPISR